MYKIKNLFYIKALTPIHAGSGQTLGYVDSPIQREQHSNIPKIEASSLKGSIKHYLYKKFNCDESKNLEESDLSRIFGPENGEEHASSIAFTDARLLFFPVKSTENIFKLITCPYILKRWLEDYQIIIDSINSINSTKQKKIEEKESEHLEKLSEETKNFINTLEIPEGRCLFYKNTQIVLEEYIFEDLNAENFINLAEFFVKLLKIEKNKIVILNDSDFIDLVNMYTEIITRNKIDTKKGTAAETGLFTEEYLPSESILYFLVMTSPNFLSKKGENNNLLSAQNDMEFFLNNIGKIFQIGGNETIGKGIVKKLIPSGDSNE